jgi:alanine racemase
VSADVFRANLRHLKNNVLPAGWQLAAVQKWNGYGNSILKLAGTAAKEGLPVCVLTNQEAGDVVKSAAAAAGAEKLTIWRIMPADGPVKYAEIYEAAKAGLDIVVSHLQLHNSCSNTLQRRNS